MKHLLIIFLTLSASAFAQSGADYKDYLVDSLKLGRFIWSDTDKIISIAIDLKKANEFEFYQLNRYECNYQYSVYGKGIYSQDRDSLRLFFDSIPSYTSTCIIDSVENNDKLYTIQIQVTDSKGNLLDSLIMNGEVSTEAFYLNNSKLLSVAFDKETVLNLKLNQGIGYLYVTKKGYLRCSINLPKEINKDYTVKLVLQKEPDVYARDYISNLIIALKFISNCELEFVKEKVLHHKDCK